MEASAHFIETLISLIPIRNEFDSPIVPSLLLDLCILLTYWKILGELLWGQKRKLRQRYLIKKSRWESKANTNRDIAPFDLSTVKTEDLGKSDRISRKSSIFAVACGLLSFVWFDAFNPVFFWTIAIIAIIAIYIVEATFNLAPIRWFLIGFSVGMSATWGISEIFTLTSSPMPIHGLLFFLSIAALSILVEKRKKKDNVVHIEEKRRKSEKERGLFNLVKRILGIRRKA